MATVLLTGNTKLFTPDALERLAEDNTVVLAAEAASYSGRNRNIRVYETTPMEEKFAQLFDVYTFEAVWYISGYADGGEGSFGEAQLLERTLLECANSLVDKVILLSTNATQNCEKRYGSSGELLQTDYPDGRTFNAVQLEELGRYFARRTGLKVITLWLPYVADRLNDENFLGRIFHRMERDEPILLPYRPGDRVDFISLTDLCGLLLQITGETEDDTASYFVVSGYQHTFGDLEEHLNRAKPGITVNYEKLPNSIDLPVYPTGLRRRYGFIPMDDVMDSIVDYYRCFGEEVTHTGENSLMRFLRVLTSGVFKYLELIILFFLTEFISRYTSDSVYFRFVDVRLAFIVIMGTIHGMRHGILAAILESFVLVAKFIDMGMRGTLLFYNIENWIPFVVYLMAGSIAGYIRDKNTEELSFANKEYDLLRSKYIFLTNVYHGAIQNKGEFKRQILGFKDSFGKIFDTVQKLDNELPQSIFLEGLRVMEEILENRTVAIYTVDSWQRFGRLVACSSNMRSQLTVSIRLEDYSQMYDCVKEGEVWRNIELVQGLPMYACGVFQDKSVVMLIVLWEATAEQYGTRYTNIFQILCGLVQTSFLRALDYEEFRQEQITVPGTRAVTPERFRQLLEVQEEMQNAGASEYLLLRFADQDIHRVGDEIAGLVRASDTLGLGEDGKLYLLLTQMSRDNFHFVRDRLDSKGLRYQIVGGE